jgi:rsbT co-antagonist protein RsbR
MESQISAGFVRSGQIKEDELKDQSQRFLREFVVALESGETDQLSGAAWNSVRDLLADFSRARAVMGFTPAQTATFVFSLKEPLFALLRDQIKDDANKLAEEMWTATKLVDGLGLYTTEVYQQSRDDIIKRQAQELLELSTVASLEWLKFFRWRFLRPCSA